MMKAIDSIAPEIHEYLRSTHVTDPSFSMETDLIASNQLDSLVVMDIVCFLESRFGIRMEPDDVNPANLQSVACLARYVAANLRRAA